GCATLRIACHLARGSCRQRVIREPSYQRPLHFTRASLVALRLQFVSLGEELAGVHGLQAGAELLFGSCSLIEFFLCRCLGSHALPFCFALFLGLREVSLTLQARQGGL